MGLNSIPLAGYVIRGHLFCYEHNYTLIVKYKFQQRLEAEEAERKQRELEKAAERLRIDTANRENKERISALAKHKEMLRNFGKKHNYFILDENEKVQNMIELEKLCDILPLDK